MSDEQVEGALDAPPGQEEGVSRPSIWVTTTYFAEGFPYTIVNSLAEVLFKEAGASLQAIGLTSLFHLPWNIKFLWGPFLDAYETKRSWLLGIEVGLTAVIVAMALLSSFGTLLTGLSILFVALAFLSATHDIAIDGYYMEALDKKGQSRFVGPRATAYRIAMWVVSGPMIGLIAYLGWTGAFLVMAAMMGALLTYHAFYLPRAESRKRPIGELARAFLKPRILTAGVVLAIAIGGTKMLWNSSPVQRLLDGILASAPVLGKISAAEWIAMAFLVILMVIGLRLNAIRARIEGQDSFYTRAFVDFLSQDRVGYILAFVIFFRTGESFLLKMRYAFLRDIGMTMEQFGWAAGTFGLFTSMGATIVGGNLIARYGLRRCIWPFVLLQNSLHLLYMAVAWYHHQVGVGAIGFPLLTAVISLEAFGSGLGIAVLMVYMMRACRPAYKAAHMAILTALMSLSFTLAGVASGFLAARWGYTLYFGFTFVASIPGMALLLFVPYLDAASDVISDKPRANAK